MRIYLSLICAFFSSTLAGDDYARARELMLEDIMATVRYTSEYIGKTSLSKRVMEAMASVPRHEFLTVEMRPFAYRNEALPISGNQTISQPYIVALMSDLAEVGADDKVLEIGTGSGYQAAVLAELGREVFSIEIIESLGKEASSTLQRLGYQNISLRIGDGYHGWPESAPFDAILVTAAPKSVPEALLEQLSPGGKLIIPLGEQGRVQTLKVFEKDEHGTITIRDVLPVGFVPLTRKH